MHILGGLGNTEEGSPAGCLWLIDREHVDIRREPVPFTGIAGNAGTDYVFPGVFASLVAGYYMIDIERLVVESNPAVLTGKAVSFKHVAPGKLHLFLR